MPETSKPNETENAKAAKTNERSANDRSLFVTEMIRATGLKNNLKVDVWLNGNIDDESFITGIPIAIDKYFIKFDCGGEEIWINKSAIIGCRINKPEITEET